MTAQSTQFTITYRTAAMPRPEFVPGYLRCDFNPARLGAWLVWVVMWMMTVDSSTSSLGGLVNSLFDNAVFVALWAVVLGCVAYLQVGYYVGIQIKAQ
jgi:hypothetical protein